MISAVEIAQALGQRFAPNSEQIAVIESDPDAAMLVVAGAGAGKTETMAARVVWLVANGYITPDRVLGLTFTNKAARELGERIRQRLLQLAASGIHPPEQTAAAFQAMLETAEPTVITYDAYATKLVGEYGLLIPCEPGARVVSRADQILIARNIVAHHEAATPFLSSSGEPLSIDTVTQRVLELDQQMRNHLITAQQIAEDAQAYVDFAEEAAKFIAPRAAAPKFKEAQEQRLQLLPLVAVYREQLRQENLVTFGEQMQYAAQLAQTSPRVRTEQRRRFGVVMLDEYQDTSHAQRIMLRELFRGQTVTAVGDPMQSIYGWRGATSANLKRVLADFGTPEHPAVRRQMTVSFRNPETVLHYANVVADSLLETTTGKRSVAPLQAHPANGTGQVDMAFFATQEAEVHWVAQQLRNVTGSAAVLVRTKAMQAVMATALEQAGVPYEIVGLAGLLDVPEVQDLCALATLLIRPGDAAALARVLGGPMLNLGPTDFAALQRWERQLTTRALADYMEAPAIGAAQTPAEVDASQAADWEAFQRQLSEYVAQQQQPRIGLGEAIATWAEHSNAQLRELGLEPPQFSPAAQQRLRWLHRQLHRLRQQALHYGLADLFAEIEQSFGLRTEVLQRENPHAPGAAGTVHLDAFATHVVEFSRHHSGGLAQFLDYCAVVAESDDGFSRGEVTPRADCVQILTVHKAKGLEWDTVAVIGSEKETYYSNLESWVTQASQVPNSLRGDRQQSRYDAVGMPLLPPELLSDTLADYRAAEGKTKELRAARAYFEDSLQAYLDRLKQISNMEADRIFYVALTRASQHLLITGSADRANRLRPRHPLPIFEHMAELDDAPASAQVVSWATGDDEEVQRELAAHPQATEADYRYPRSYQVAGATELANMLDAAQVPEFDDSFALAGVWEADVDALIAEHTQLQDPHLDVTLPLQLSPTALIALREDPSDYARRLVRPIPYEPVPFAKRGTAFHQWVEEVMYQGDVLLEEIDFDGTAPETDELDATLQELKDQFRASEWYSRPGLVGTEIGFQLELGGHTFSGRIDAVYRNPDGGWTVVDWKTGRVPSAASLQQKQLQLALYRLAWAARENVPASEVSAAFYYVAHDYTLWCEQLPDAADIAAMIQGAYAQEREYPQNDSVGRSEVKHGNSVSTP